MATTYGMGGGTPVMSTVMPPPSGMGGMTTPMTAQNMSGMNIGGFTRNMNLPLSMNPPIQVDENTPNLEEIQSFPVAGRALDGTHFHQDPVTGQMYRMTDELHARIPQILANRRSQTRNGMGTTVSTTNISNLGTQSSGLYLKPAPEQPLLTINGEAIISNKISGDSIRRLFNRNGDFLNNVDSLSFTSIFGSANFDNRYDTSISTNQAAKYITQNQKTPINRLVNLTPSSVMKFTLSRYTPINVFMNLSQNLILNNIYDDKYIPINKFNNIR